MFCKVAHLRNPRVCIKVFDWALCLLESRSEVTNTARLGESLFNVTNGLIHSAEYIHMMFFDVLLTIILYIPYFSSHWQMRILIILALTFVNFVFLCFR